MTLGAATVAAFHSQRKCSLCALSHAVMSDSTPWTVARQDPWGILQARILEWVATPSSRGSSQSRSPTLHADSLLSESLVKPKDIGIGSLSLLQGIFPTQELNQGVLHCRWILLPAELPVKPVSYLQEDNKGMNVKGLTVLSA